MSGVELDDEDVWWVGWGIKVKTKRAVTPEVSKLGHFSS